MNHPKWIRVALFSIGLAINTPAFSQTQESLEAQQLTQRLAELSSNPEHASLAALERIQAQQAINTFTRARRHEIATALQIAQWRVETAELALQTELIHRQIQELERERGELILKASRREAERARQEAERLRIQAQIQAEEAERLRMAVEAEAHARQEAEGVLDTVTNDQVERARRARQRAAELKAQEEALRRSLEEQDPR